MKPTNYNSTPEAFQAYAAALTSALSATWNTEKFQHDHETTRGHIDLPDGPRLLLSFDAIHGKAICLLAGLRRATPLGRWLLIPPTGADAMRASITQPAEALARRIQKALAPGGSWREASARMDAEWQRRITNEVATAAHVETLRKAGAKVSSYEGDNHEPSFYLPDGPRGRVTSYGVVFSHFSTTPEEAAAIFSALAAHRAAQPSEPQA